MAASCCLKSAGGQLCAAAQDRAGARRRRERAARKYRPDDLSLLIVAEAPPACVQRYFYFDDVPSDDWLFRGVVEAVLGEPPVRADKDSQLRRLQQRGVWMIDLKIDPKEHKDEKLDQYVADLVKRARRYDPAHVVLVKVNVFDTACPALRDAGLPVVEERVPFPSTGQQEEFRKAMRRALKTIGWRAG